MSWFRSFPLSNIYHCTVHKSGSQWLAGLLSDDKVRRRTGMKTFTYQNLLAGGFDPRKITDRYFYLPFPEKRIITPLYISYPCYKHIIKPASYKSLYIFRDPRDVLISYYHSVKKSHPLMGGIESIRAQLQMLNQEDGIIYCIDVLKKQGLWESMRSWSEADDDKLLLVRYENLIGHLCLDEFARIFDHLEIKLSNASLKHLIEKHNFENVSGRKAGLEQDLQHNRKGIAGDWKNYVTPALSNAFRLETDQINLTLGYDT